MWVDYCVVYAYQLTIRRLLRCSTRAIWRRVCVVFSRSISQRGVRMVTVVSYT